MYFWHWNFVCFSCFYEPTFCWELFVHKQLVSVSVFALAFVFAMCFFCVKDKVVTFTLAIHVSTSLHPYPKLKPSPTSFILILPHISTHSFLFLLNKLYMFIIYLFFFFFMAKITFTLRVFQSRINNINMFSILLYSYISTVIGNIYKAESRMAEENKRVVVIFYDLWPHFGFMCGISYFLC